MSLQSSVVEETEIHYICDNQEFILGEDVTPEIQSLLVSDGSQAILVNGQYLVTDDENQTILLQESDSNLPQFYINSDGNDIVFDSGDSVQLVNEETESEVQQVIYYTDINEAQEQAENIEGIQDEEGNIYPFKKIKLEGQLLNFDEFVQHQMEEKEQESSSEYTIVDDDILSDSQTIDLSKITGRNLITGQTVTLDNYLERLKKRLHKSVDQPIKRHKKPDLTNLLDKKISLGTTKSGKKLVGKIIHVEKKSAEPIEPAAPSTPVKEGAPCAEKFEQLSKILGGVMEMESVRRKLEHKSLAVKLLEKKYSLERKSYVRKTSFCYGYMNHLEDDDWEFLADEIRKPKFFVTISLTVVISHEKSGKKTIKVNLNPSSVCHTCLQPFKTNVELRVHMSQAHVSNACGICEKTFETLDALTEHQLSHVDEGKLFMCEVCEECFVTLGKLQAHAATHELFRKPLECTVCQVRCSSEWALKKHLLSHTGLKLFACDVCLKSFGTESDVNAHRKVHFPEKHFTCSVCLRSFGRHSNLLRHMEIHRGNGVLHTCDICGCGYNFMSSLTRHMVQSHIEHTAVSLSGGIVFT